MTSTLPWLVLAATRTGRATIAPAGSFSGVAGRNCSTCSTATAPSNEKNVGRPKHMPHYAPIHFSYERDRECLGGARCGNDELLCVIADCQSLERCDRDLGDGANIGTRFTSD